MLAAIVLDVSHFFGVAVCEVGKTTKGVDVLGPSSSPVAAAKPMLPGTAMTAHNTLCMVTTVVVDGAIVSGFVGVGPGGTT
jgi:hypothetical protein